MHLTCEYADNVVAYPGIRPQKPQLFKISTSGTLNFMMDSNAAGDMFSRT
jgi:hypothetical protein